jgi:hypothetical protein
MLAVRACLELSVVAAALALIADLARGTPPPEPRDWCVGSIDRGSLEREGEGYRMHLHIDVCSQTLEASEPLPRELVVTYPRELPYDVCDGSFVYVRGDQHGAAFAARTLALTNPGKYDGCLHEHCLAPERRSPKCSLQNRFE